jgi:hypothetical protein
MHFRTKHKGRNFRSPFPTCREPPTAPPEGVSMEDKIRPHIVKLSGDPNRDYDGLLRNIGDARVVMVGEASHGTRDFYDERQKITRRLVEEKVSARAQGIGLVFFVC